MSETRAQQSLEAGSSSSSAAAAAAAATARRRCSEAVALPRQQTHGVAAVLALIDTPSAAPAAAAPSRRKSTKTAESLPTVAGFGKPRNPKIRWSTPLHNDEDLNGRRKLQPKSTLPARSGLVGGRAGRRAPDTRSSCAQTGISGTFSMPGDDGKEEEEEQRDEGCAMDADPAPSSPPARASAPAPGSLLGRQSDGGPYHENGGVGKTPGVPGVDVAAPDALSAAASAPASARIAAPATARSAGAASVAVTLPASYGSEVRRERGETAAPEANRRAKEREEPGETDAARTGGTRLNSNGRSVAATGVNAVAAAIPVALPRPQPAECAEENGNEEQGRELMMSAMADGSEEQGQQLMASAMTGGSSAGEDDFGELAGEEEQGRELMMMFSGADPPAVSPTAGADDEDAVPLSPSPSPRAAESEDGGVSVSSSGSEDEDEREASEEDAFEPPVTTIAWRTPKKTSKEELILGGDGGGSTSGSAASAIACEPGTPTTSHKPRLSIRNFTRFSDSSGAAADAEGATTRPTPFSYKRPPQPPAGSTADDRCAADAGRTIAPPAPGVPVQQVSWRSPRQTAPASVTPHDSVDEKQEQGAGQQHENKSSAVLQLELPSEVAMPLDVEVTNPDRGASVETPFVSWRTPGRSDRLMPCPTSQQAEHSQPAVAPSSPTSLLSYSGSSVDGDSSRSGDEQSEPIERGEKPLPRFGAYPFRPPDERDSVPQSQLQTLASNSARLFAQKASAERLQRRREQEEASARARTNSAPPNGRQPVNVESGQPAKHSPAGSPSSALTTRESSSRSSSRSRSRSQVGVRKSDHAARASSPRHVRDSRDRGHKRGGYDDRRGSSRSNSSRTGSGSSTTAYHDDDRRDDRRDGLSQDSRIHRDRGSGGYGNTRDAFGRDTRDDFGRGSRGRSYSNSRDTRHPGRRSDGSYSNSRDSRSDTDGGGGGRGDRAYVDRRSGHRSSRPRDYRRRDSSRSPLRGRSRG
ncbi:unnamed protein product [Scytosiphon promiscuus]